MEGGMASEDAGDKARFSYGPRPLSALVPTLVRPAFRRRAPATAQVLADWDAIVGPAIAAISTPLKLSAGTLAIGCTGPVAMELQHLSDALIGRINGHLGQVVVNRLRFVQSAPRPVPALPRETAAGPSPRVLDAARRAVAGLPEGPLRDALERLGRAVLTDRGDRDTGG
jgi:hypothetical protein